MTSYSCSRSLARLLFHCAGALLAVVAQSASAADPPYYDVRSYGATGDGRTLETAAIQKAVDTCAAAGGGKVVIPAGQYLTGPIFLKSRVQVEIESGAVLVGSTNFSDYPVIDGRWEGIERKIYASLFTGRGLHDVSITGRGVLEGQGAVWWAAHRKTLELRKKLGIKGREPEHPPDAPLRWPRPRIINLYNCTNVLVRDLTIQNSPSWQVHPVYCENVTLDNLTIIAPANSANTDAVDPDSCRNVRISNCHFDVGDDCIVIKSGYNEDGRRVGIPCENIVICNCTFARGHGGVVIGSEMSGSVRNVTVANCVFDGTQRGIRVKTAPGRGGVIEYFRASNLVMRNITDAAFSVTAAYADTMTDAKTEAAAETIPHMRHFYWGDISVVNAKKVADLSSIANSPLEDLRLYNVQAVGAKAGIVCENAKGVVLQDISLQPESGPAIEARKVTNLEVLRLAVEKPKANTPVLLLDHVSQALVHGCQVGAGPDVFVRCAGEADQGITVEGNRLPAAMKERQP
jgi:polygalacturonase